jgi:nucleotide-binding universal stress UspA family protein
MRAAVWKHILCPVDFSDTAGIGLRYAAALARCSQSRLTVLYADRFEPPVYFTRSQVEHFMEQCRECKAQAERRLHEFVQTEFGPDSPEIESRVVEGYPAETIVRISRELNAGLIVMGTHGRSGLNRWTLGSVAEYVLGETQVPPAHRMPTDGSVTAVARHPDHLVPGERHARRTRGTRLCGGSRTMLCRAGDRSARAGKRR